MVDFQQVLVSHITNRARATARLPLVVGICGAQGSGKSTLAEQMKTQLQKDGLKVAVLSLDDLYLTREVRTQLGHTVHPLLQTRGVPGTHDVELGLAMVDALGRAGMVRIPVFDKSHDDRVPPSQWRQVKAPVDIVLFEGWCVGATPESESAVLEAMNDWERTFDPTGIWRRFVNDSLAGRYQQLFSRIDLLILLAAPSFDVVYGWRLEQERKLRESVLKEGRDPGRILSDTEVLHFIRHYERLTRHIAVEMPSRADILVALDINRQASVVRPKDLGMG